MGELIIEKSSGRHFGGMHAQYALAGGNIESSSNTLPSLNRERVTH
jgi:hypothetical protein